MQTSVAFAFWRGGATEQVRDDFLMQSIKSHRELAQSATTWYARGDLNPYPRGMEPKGDVTLVKGSNSGPRSAA